MPQNHSHYYSKSPDVNVKIFTISESLRKHLYIFKTITGIFSYKKIDLGTKVFIKHITIPKKSSTLLDLGCGYGVIGIVLGYQSPQSQVYLIDVNKRAIWSAKENIKINLPYNKKNVVALEGDYFEPINKKNLKFDGIYINPPLRQGRKEFLKLCSDIPSHLKPNGFFQFVIKKNMGASYILDYLTNFFPQAKIDVVCKRSGYWVFYCTFD